ncbi:Aste57867_16473 [Aphanomyces stellatus]|uniref:Aste57867_16473 protein n=1 Tax=Aphanomyces stellatus TaxID=120398 RepID=A0A485L6C0_9STRA|nr:hypothetical protein As57867_016416 [Aphanomyces stellatus]VFT93247.1 Aste57867_16473 [Aphanomyces stellatus]
MSKPASVAKSIATMPAVATPTTNDVFSTPIAPKFAAAKKRAAVDVTPVEVFEDSKRQKKVEGISPDEKQQPNLTKAIQFLESEKENIYGSDNEFEQLLTQREASLPSKPSKSAEKRAPLKQLEPVMEKDVPKKALAKATKKKDLSKKKLPVQATKLNFFAPKTPEHDATPEESEEKVPPSPDVVDITPSPAKPVAAAAHTVLTTGTFTTIETKGSQLPSQRWGCTATMVSNQRIVVYGGESDDESTLSDLFVFDMVKQEWSCPMNCESIPRTWHSAVFLEQKNLLLVFGGERVVNGGHETLSDVMVLDTGACILFVNPLIATVECFLWYPPAVSGTPPMARSGHSSVVLGNDVVVFGGTRGRSHLSTIHLLDIETWHWRTVKVDGKAPTARTYHNAVALGPHRMVIFGGNDAKKSYDSVHVLERKSDKDAWSWFNPCVVGNGPSPRTGASAVPLDDRTIVIYGGWDPQNPNKVQLYGDVYTLDTESWEWGTMAIETNKASLQCVGHVGVKTGEHTVLYFGGQDATEVRRNDVRELTLRGS